MRFKLSNETLRAVEKSTGCDYPSLVNRPMHGCPSAYSVDAERRHIKENSHIIPPRGSVYLQMGRVTSLDVVKKFIFNFK